MMENDDRLYDFIAAHSKDDVAALALRSSRQNFLFDLDYALMQIKCRQKAVRKIPSFLNRKEFLFPSLLSSEQASDETVANFHASLVPSDSVVLDMTAGLGIDAMSIARKTRSMTAIDLDETKVEHLSHNSEVLGINNLNVICDDSIRWLNSCGRHFDVIMIDPARRGTDGKRLVSLSDCQPDVVSNLPLLLEHCDTLIIKASPLLDITQTCRELPGIISIYTVCAHGECKEILAVVKKNGRPEKISSVDLTSSSRPVYFEMPPDEERSEIPLVENIDALETGFIYEPNPALMKLNASSKICSTFPGMRKLSASSNLYHSAVQYDNFPGKAFRILSLPDKKSLKGMKGEHINVIARNYVMKADEIMKKYAFLPGKETYLIGTRFSGSSSPLMILCRQLS